MFIRNWKSIDNLHFKSIQSSVAKFLSQETKNQKEKKTNSKGYPRSRTIQDIQVNRKKNLNTSLLWEKSFSFIINRLNQLMMHLDKLINHKGLKALEVLWVTNKFPDIQPLHKKQGKGCFFSEINKLLSVTKKRKFKLISTLLYVIIMSRTCFRVNLHL